MRLAMLLEQFVNERQLGVEAGAETVGEVLSHPPEVAPDLVVEVLSPSNTRRDIQARLDDYRQVGALEFWLVSPDAKTVEVLRLSVSGINGGSLQRRSYAAIGSPPRVPIAPEGRFWLTELTRN